MDTIHGEDNKLEDIKRKIEAIEKRQENINPFSIRSQRDVVGNRLASPSNPLDK